MQVQSAPSTNICKRQTILAGHRLAGGSNLSTHWASMVGGVVSTMKVAVAGEPWLPTASTAYTAAHIGAGRGGTG